MAITCKIDTFVHIADNESENTETDMGLRVMKQLSSFGSLIIHYTLRITRTPHRKDGIKRMSQPSAVDK
jgi:hypothetical protein